MIGAMALRVGLIACSFAAVALCAVALRGVEARRWTFVLLADPGAAEVRAGQAKLERARTWAPDGPALLMEATLLDRAGEQAQAERVLERLVRLEPENALAWEALARVSTDEARAEAARAERRRLAPPVPAVE